MQRASWLFALATVFTLAACGDDSGTGPAPTVSATLELRNDANVPITMVHIAPCSEAEWGENRLTGGESVAPGALRSFSLAPDCYDVRASTGEKFGTWWDREMIAGDTVRLALPASAGSAEAGAVIAEKVR
jgi:hypothetical protein